MPDTLHGEPRLARAAGSWPMIAAFVRSIFEQSDEEATWSKLGEVIDKLTSAGFND